jgi:hypothetical protein
MKIIIQIPVPDWCVADLSIETDGGWCVSLYAPCGCEGEANPVGEPGDPDTPWSVTSLAYRCTVHNPQRDINLKEWLKYRIPDTAPL